MKSFFVVLSVFAYLSARASLADGGPLFGGGSQTPYQQLQLDYQNAKNPAALGDFLPASDSTTQQCVAVGRDAQTIFGAEYVEKITAGGIEKLFFGHCADKPCDAATALKSYDYLTLTSSATDLIIENLDPSMSSTPFKAYLRKDNNYIFYGLTPQQTPSAGGPIFNSDFAWYGYCWSN